MKRNLKNIFFIILKILVFLIAWGYVGYVLIIEKHIFEIDFEAHLSLRYHFLFFAISLMPLNWFLESVKWKELIAVVQILSYKKAFSIVFRSLVFALVTPNRVGEIVSRASYLEPGNKVKGASLTLIGSVSQFLITLIFGTLSIVVFLNFDNQGLRSFNVLLISLIICIPLLIYLYLSPWVIGKFVASNRFLRKLFPDLELLKTIPRKLLLKAVFISFLRYCVFVFQYTCCILFFKIELTVELIMLSISVIYLLITIIPTIALAEFGIRGPVAIFIFGFLTSKVHLIFYATILIWIINIAVPALIGSLFLLRKKKSAIEK